MVQRLTYRKRHSYATKSYQHRFVKTLDKSVNSAPRRMKPLKRIGICPILDMEIVDVGPPADWVKINVRESKDCFEVYALVPGLLREEVTTSEFSLFDLILSLKTLKIIAEIQKKNV